MSKILDLNDIKGLLIVANSNGVDTPCLVDILTEIQETAFERGYDASRIIDIVDILKCQEDTIDELCSLGDNAHSRMERNGVIVSPPSLESVFV